VFRVVLLTLIFAAGCFQRSDEVGLAAPPGDDDNLRGDAGISPTDPGSFPCTEDTDCVLAGATCCECPSFAVPVGFGGFGECNGVMCPMMPSCPAVEARCISNTCTTTCAPLACDLTCADGFVTDAAGCLTCACAAPQPPDGGCQVDSDCVRVGADCCGCERGGTSTAVPASQVGAFQDMLGCPANPSCPGVNVCSTEEPRCLQGMCTLSSTTLPTDACGRPDLPACGPGETCVLNESPEASAGGVGACGPTSTP